MRFATVCALFCFALIGDVFALEDEGKDPCVQSVLSWFSLPDQALLRQKLETLPGPIADEGKDPCVQSVLFGFSPSDQALLRQALETVPGPIADVLPRYLGLADNLMEAADLAQVLLAIGKTPPERRDQVFSYAKQFVVDGVVGCDKAGIIKAAVELCLGLNYDAVLMEEFKTRYQAYMPLVMKSAKAADCFLKFVEAMKAGKQLEPDDEYAGLLAFYQIGNAHARVFQSLVELYLSKVPAEGRNESWDYCCHFFPWVDWRPCVPRVDVVEMVNTFGVLSQEAEGLTEKFLSEAEELKKYPKYPLAQNNLMFSFITEERAKEIEAREEFDELEVSLFDVTPPYANMWTVRALTEACLNVVPQSYWKELESLYNYVSAFQTMDGYVGANLIKSLAPLCGKLDAAGQSEFLSEIRDAVSKMVKPSPHQFVRVVQGLSQTYLLLPDANDRIKVSQYVFADPSLDVVQRINMITAFAKILPVLEALPEDRRTKILDLWESSRGDFSSLQQPDELFKFFRQFQLIQINKAVSQPK